LGSDKRKNNHILNFQLSIINFQPIINPPAGGQFFKKLIAVLVVILLFFLRVSLIPKLDLKDGQKVKVTGSLKEEPQIFANRQKFNLGQFEVWGNRYPEYHYGDELRVTGKIKLKNQYFGRKFYILSYTEIETVSGVVSNTSLVGKAIKLRTKLRLLFMKYFSQPLDGLVAGVVLGDKNLLPTDFWKKLQQTGTLHIIVASGMNIAMFSKGLLSFLSIFFRRRIATVLLIVLIWFYSAMTGLQAPIIRAATMMTLIYLSNISGREAEAGRVLFLTGLFMIFINPFWLWDIGFQLSFLAVTGLVYVQPILRILTKNLNRVVQSDNFLSSVAAQITTLPILLCNFGQFNILSPFINLIILWAVPYILQIGIFVALLGLLWIKLGEIASYLLFPFLFFIEQSINLFAKVKIFQIETPKFSWWWAVVYYLILWWWIKNSKFKV